MRKKLWNNFIFICSILVMMLAFNVNAFAEERSFNCTVTGHYKNPLTGVVEDSGGEKSMATGQGMVSGVVNSKGKLTIIDGKYYLDFTLSLAEFSSGHNFVYADSGDKVPCSLVGHGNDDNGKTNKYRAELKGEDTVLRISMYVEPMGRNVIFFITANKLKEIGNLKGGEQKETNKNGVNKKKIGQKEVNKKEHTQQLQPLQPQVTQGQSQKNSVVQSSVPEIQQGQNSLMGVQASPDSEVNGMNQAQGGYTMPPVQGGYTMPPVQGGYAMPPVQNGYAMPPAQGGYAMPPVQGGYAMPPAQNGYGMIQPQNSYEFLPNWGWQGNGYYPVNPENNLSSIQNPMMINPNLTAVDPRLEFNNTYSEASSDGVKGLVLSTEKEAQEESQKPVRVKIHLNEEILEYIFVLVQGFVLCFTVTFGVGYFKKKKRE